VATDACDWISVVPGCDGVPSTWRSLYYLILRRLITAILVQLSILSNPESPINDYTSTQCCACRLYIMIITWRMPSIHHSRSAPSRPNTCWPPLATRVSAVTHSPLGSRLLGFRTGCHSLRQTVITTTNLVVTAQQKVAGGINIVRGQLLTWMDTDIGQMAIQLFWPVEWPYNVCR